MKAPCAVLILVSAVTALHCQVLAAQDRSTRTAAVPKQKISHDGGRDDLEAIGKRKLFKDAVWYSIDTEIKIGKQQSQQIEEHMKLLLDEAVNGYINRV